jgi:Holliday junction resolvase
MPGHYAAGARTEHKVRDLLESEGYECVRTAGSKGALDLLAVKPGEVLMVQVKRSGVLSPAGWNRLYDLAAMAGAIPILADCPVRKPIVFYRLTARKDKPGRQPYEVFLLDRVEV